jgi:hypothetical protein
MISDWYKNNQKWQLSQWRYSTNYKQVGEKILVKVNGKLRLLLFCYKIVAYESLS